METVIGFVVGYLVGTSHGRAGLAKVRTSAEAIRTSPELRRLAGEATGIAGIVLRQATPKGVAGAASEVTGRLLGRQATETPRAA
jgi:hypothetical protein